MHERITRIEDGLGIIRIEIFIEQNIIPQYVSHRLKHRYLDWLLASSEQQVNRNAINSSLRPHLRFNKKNETDDNDIWEDITEFRREKEMDRLLEDVSHLTSANNDCQLFAKALKSCEIAYQNLQKDFHNKKISLQQFHIYEAAGNHEYNSMLQVIQSRDIDPVWAEGVAKDEHVYHVSFAEKCRLYATWTDQLKKSYMKEIQSIEEHFTMLSAKFSELRDLKYLYVARQADIVGMTTTGAATYQSMLLDLKPKIGECHY